MAKIKVKKTVTKTFVLTLSEAELLALHCILYTGVSGEGYYESAAVAIGTAVQDKVYSIGKSADDADLVRTNHDVAHFAVRS